MARPSTIPADATEDHDEYGIPRDLDLSADAFVSRQRPAGPRPRRLDLRAVIEARLDRRQRAFAKQQVVLRERLSLDERALVLARAEEELGRDQSADLTALALLDQLDAAEPSGWIQ